MKVVFCWRTRRILSGEVKVWRGLWEAMGGWVYWLCGVD